MRQSNIIFGSLLFAFIVYITIRGQLPGYLDLFRGRGNGGQSASASGDKTPTSGTPSKPDDAIQSALNVYGKFSTMFG